MSDCVALSPFDGGALFDWDGALVGIYSRDTGRGIFAHSLFADVRTCTMERTETDWHGEGFPPNWVCGECGGWTCGFERPNYCMDCGCKVAG